MVKTTAVEMSRRGRTGSACGVSQGSSRPCDATNPYQHHRPSTNVITVLTSTTLDHDPRPVGGVVHYGDSDVLIDTITLRRRVKGKHYSQTLTNRKCAHTA